MALLAAATAAMSLLGVAPARAGVQPVGLPTLFVYGDSITRQVLPYLKPGLAGRYAVEHFEVPGTAPCDWLTRPNHVEVERVRPALVYVETAAVNAASGCMTAGGPKPRPDSATFLARYEGALLALFGDLERANGAVCIVYFGGPPIGFPSANDASLTLYRWVRKVARDDHHLVVSTAARSAVASPGGTFAQRLTCLPTETAAMGCTGGTIEVRAFDDVHFWCAVRADLMDCPDYSSGAYRWGTAALRVLLATR